MKIIKRNNNLYFQKIQWDFICNTYKNSTKIGIINP
jgi:hypothetical protein